MRQLVRPFLAALALPLVSCMERSLPVEPTVHAAATPANAESQGIIASSTALRLLMIEVGGGDLEAPLRYDVVLNKGVSPDRLPLPEGSAYDVVTRGYDAEGRLTHSGKTSIERVSVDETPSFQMELSPVGKGERVKLEVGIDGQRRFARGWKVLVHVEGKELVPGSPLRLRASVVDENGKPVETGDSPFRWFIDEPRPMFDPRRPPHEAEIHVSIRIDFRYPPERLSVGLVIRDLIGIVHIPVSRLNDYVDVSAGQSATCGVRRQGSIECWGSDEFGLLGDGTNQLIDTQCGEPNAAQSNFRCTPAPIAGGRRYRAVSVGEMHACAIEQGTDNVYCWGSNGHRQLGIEPSGGYWPLEGPTVPVSGPSGPLAFRSVTVGAAHTCGVTTANENVCWGYNGYGQLGPNASTSGPLVLQPGGGAPVIAGRHFTCAGGQCYGRYATKPPQGTFLTAVGLASTAEHGCGIASNPRQVWCWGRNGSGQLGDGLVNTSNPSLPAVRVERGAGLLEADLVTTGGAHSCAIDGTTAYCWGANFNGAIGTGVMGGNYTSAQLVRSPNGPLNFTRISAGARHTCGIANGAVMCWGENFKGELGVGWRHMISNPYGPFGIAEPLRVIGS